MTGGVTAAVRPRWAVPLVPFADHSWRGTRSSRMHLIRGYGPDLAVAVPAAGPPCV